MPRNGSGTYVLPESAFVPGTPISSSAVNSDFSDVASALTGSVAADGQTPITGQLKASSGSVGLPGYSFSADPDSGFYRIAANNLGISVNATKILDIGTTGLSVTGTVAPSTTVTNPDGTVLLPSYTFASDLDSGMYRIGANNIGIAVNAAKVLDIGTGGLNVVGTISTNGAVLSPLAQGGGMVNGTIVESHTGNAATFAVKTLAGNDPSAGDPVFVPFRNVTAATGNYTVLTITAALSLTVSSGSTLGVPGNSIPFKPWLVIFNNGGTPLLGIINNVFGLNIYPLGQLPIANSTAEGGVGGADNAQTFYTSSAVTSKAYAVIGYASYESGLATAGSWAASPTNIQLFNSYVPLPGASLQTQRSQTSASANGTTTIPIDDTIPQSSEGDQYLSQAFGPSSAANILRVRSSGLYSSNSAGQGLTVALFRDAGANAIAATSHASASGNQLETIYLETAVLASSTSATTFKIRAGNVAAGTTTFNGSASARLFGGAASSFLEIQEVVT